MSSDDPKAVAYEVESLRKLAFFGIAISTVATLTAIIAVPMLYNYMQHVQSSLQTEVDFCRHRTDGLWDEYGRFEHLKGVNGRIKRSSVPRRSNGYTGRVSSHRRAVVHGASNYDGGYGGGGYGEAGFDSGVNGGPPGDPGMDGAPGNPGAPGAPGAQGQAGSGGSCDHCPPPRTAPGY
ncbi:unnamed protein product [Nippostrongylus brasiliensis]|uniref:Col_cuticle_N domain-containing protein n=1 Tax=Nippostrongylus brasiliensis TaxID=27835 RepID=A0A0N4XXK9_NIPBR|nr:unnamed protein product [Nippostrongylus brasiliensis]